MKKSKVLVLGILALVGLILFLNVMSAWTCNGKQYKTSTDLCICGSNRPINLFDENAWKALPGCGWNPPSLTSYSDWQCSGTSAYRVKTTKTCSDCASKSEGGIQIGFGETATPSDGALWGVCTFTGQIQTGCSLYSSSTENIFDESQDYRCLPGTCGELCAGITPPYTNCESASYCGANNNLGLRNRDSSCSNWGDARFLCYNGIFYDCAVDGSWPFSTAMNNGQTIGNWKCNLAGAGIWSNCGNNVLETGEGCDDDGNVDGDGCSSTCTIETGYTCTGSPSVCTPVCGDGIIRGLETCDNGNAIGGDGCSSTCTIETGWKCQTNTGGTSICTPEHVGCTGALPVNASWTLQTNPGTFAQTWDSVNSIWTPASKNTEFNQASGECYFNCNSGVWNPTARTCDYSAFNYCWDLTTQTACNNAGRTIARNSALDPESCDSASCSCNWRDNECRFTMQRVYSETTTSDDCVFTTSIENNCNKVLNNLIIRYTASWFGTGSAPEYCKNDSKQISCDKVARLGFFDNLQFILSFVAVALIYFVLVSKKKL